MKSINKLIFIKNKIKKWISSLLGYYTKSFLYKLYRIIFVYTGKKFHPGYIKNISDFLFKIIELIGVNFEIITYHYINLYKKIVIKEIYMTHIYKNENILVIGCGAIPASAIIIAKKTNAKIVAIDHDRQAIKKAKQYIYYKKLQERITLNHAEGYDYDLKMFDKIFLSYGIRNTEEILAHIYKNGKTNMKLIMRLPQTNNKKDMIINNSTVKFNIECKISTNYLGPIDSFCLSKENNN
ncbi:MAG: methyltransferase domain-containing protein [Candidatus Thermoplasmatota archaeon]|nr:methyltransferase domain-containing protein [Candidatus Thermoplasmatota archaeon]